MSANAVLGIPQIEAELATITGGRVRVAFGESAAGRTLKANVWHDGYSASCDVVLSDYALTNTMDEFRERYLVPMAHYMNLEQ